MPTIRFLDHSTPPHIFTLTVMAGLPALSMTIFLPSLSSMAKDFGTSYGTMQLAVSGYLAATALIQVFIGPIADKFGRRWVILFSLSIFVLATVGTLIAKSVEVFLFFRIVQAAIASGVALSRAIISDIVPREEAASMIGYVSMGMSLVPMLGPMLGGTLDQFFGWQASFYVLGVTGLALTFLCFLDQGETVQDGGKTFEEQFKGYPVLFASPRFWGYSLCMAFSSGGLFAFFAGASFVGTSVYNLSSFMTGFVLGAPAFGYAFGTFISGRFAVRFGINSLVLYGSLLATLGLGASLLLAMNGIHSATLFFSFSILLGFGNGTTIPNATAGLLAVRPALAGTASGLGAALMIAGGAILSQIAGSSMTIETGSLPLQWVLFISSLGTVSCILFVIWRDRSLASSVSS